MKRNIDILKLICNEIDGYLYLTDELHELLELEECDIDELYDEDDSIFEAIEMHLANINGLLENLTEDLRDILDYDGFDCESFKWCVGKFMFSDIEIINYIDTFDDMINALEPIVKDNLRWYQVLIQSVTDDAKDVSEV